MRHRLVQQIEKALGWAGPESLGVGFSVGHMPDPSRTEAPSCRPALASRSVPVRASRSRCGSGSRDAS